MSKERKRSIKSAQLGLRELNIVIDNNAGTPSAIGFDRFLIDSVTDNGVGDYTINFKKAFKRACALKGHAALEADTTLHVLAVATDSIRIQVTDLAGVAKDADVGLCILGSDFKYDVA